MWQYLQGCAVISSHNDILVDRRIALRVLQRNTAHPCKKMHTKDNKKFNPDYIHLNFLSFLRAENRNFQPQMLLSIFQ